MSRQIGGLGRLAHSVYRPRKEKENISAYFRDLESKKIKKEKKKKKQAQLFQRCSPV